jgi:hypothetical protein
MVYGCTHERVSIDGEYSGKIFDTDLSVVPGDLYTMALTRPWVTCRRYKYHQRKWEPKAIKGLVVGYEARDQYRVYCNHSIIITMDVDLVPSAPMAALYPPVAIIKKDGEEDSGVALKPSKADSHSDTPPPAKSNRSLDTEISLNSITVSAPTARPAVNDDATRAVVGPSRRQSSRKNAGIFCTPRFLKERSQSTQQTGRSKGHAAVSQATTIEEPQT